MRQQRGWLAGSMVLACLAALLASASGSAARAEALPLRFVPDDAPLVLVARPGPVLRDKSMAPLVDLMRQVIPPTEKFTPFDVEQMVFFFPREGDFEGGRFPLPGVMIVTLVEGKQAEATLPHIELHALPLDPQQDGGEEGQVYSAVLDERTFAVGPWAALSPLTKRKEMAAKPKWLEHWNAIATGDAGAAIDMRWLDAKLPKDGRNREAEAIFGPLWRETELVVAGVRLLPTPQMHVMAKCKSEAAATLVHDTAFASVAVFRNFSSYQLTRMATEKGDLAMLSGPLRVMLDDVYGQTQFKIEGSVVRCTSASSVNVPQVAALIAPLIAIAQQKAKEMQSLNNLKQLALAMHNYAATYDRLPTGSMLGPDGKTPHSWRVAILPYIEQQALYEKYRLDEPWDSEHNKALLEQMPPLFRAAEGKGGTTTSYVLPQGPGLWSNGLEKRSFASLRDGTSNTIMIIETPTEIPWTKPEDLAIPAEGPLPKLGGYRPGRFAIAFGDGSVHVLSDKLDPVVLRALLTIDGGEAVNHDALK